MTENGCQQCISIRNLWQDVSFSFILCFCGSSSDSALAVEMLASRILALYCCMVLLWKADDVRLFTSRGLLEIWFRPFTVGGYPGCFHAYVNERESQSSPLRTGVHSRLNHSNFMVLEISTAWPVDSL